MSENLSPEAKLYVKEEIERTSKEIKAEVEKVKSQATKTFGTVVAIVGLLTALGVYGLVQTSIKTALSNTTITKLETDAEDLHDKIVEYETDAKDLHDKIVKYANDTNHEHTISIVGERGSTKYLNTRIGEIQAVSIPEGNVITGVYNDGGGIIFYSKSLKIEHSKSP